MTPTEPVTIIVERRNRPYAPRMAPEERREQLLDTTLRIICERGIAAVTMDAVARETGVTRPVVYGLFTDADHILRESLKREEQRARAQLTDAFPTVGQGDPGEALIGTLQGFLRAVLEAPERWRAIFMLVDSSTPTFRKRLERNRALIVQQLEALVRWGLQARGGPETDVELLARSLFALMWEAGRLVLAEPERFPPERIAAFATTMVATFFGDADVRRSPARAPRKATAKRPRKPA